MTTYLLDRFSTAMLPNGGVVEFSIIDNAIAAYEALTKYNLPDFTSGVRSEMAIQIFTRKLDLTVSQSWEDIVLQPGDWAVVGEIPMDLSENRYLSAEEIDWLDIRWILIELKEEDQ